MFPTPIPLMLREAMTEFGMDAVDGWWGELGEAARGEVIQLWREAAFGERGVARVTARFVDGDEEKESPELWHNDFYEYLVNHEIYLLDPHPPHVCTRHAVASEAVAAGVIGSEFVCPFARERECPMRQLLGRARGKSVLLRITFTST